MARTYEVSFQLGAQMAGNFARTMANASGALGQLNDHIGDLSRQQSSIQSLTRLREQVGRSSREYNQARQRVAELGRELSATENPSRELTREFEQAERQVRQTKNRLNDQRESLRNLDREMGTTGQSTRELVARQRELEQQAEKARSAQAGLQRTMAARDANVQRRDNLRGQLFDAAGMAVALAAPIKMAAAFEQQMAKVGSVSQASEADLAKLTSQARDLGATTNWSASQAAEGMEFLSMAGFGTQQTLNAMPGMLSLASAGAVDLGSAADIASNVLSGFNLEAEQMGRLGDVLTNTFTSSNTNLSMLGETMAYVAPVAETTGQSLEVTAAMAGKLGDAGIQGSQAGTALRAMMSRLTAPSKEAAGVIEQLGLRVSDADGNMRSMPEILADMDRAMQGMGNAARQEMTSTVFGLEAASAASVLLGQAGSGELQKYAESLEESGTAARVAEEQNDTAAGSMRRLMSAAESIAITMGNVLLPTLVAGAEWFSSVIGVVDQLAQQFPLLTSIVVGGTAALIALRVATIAGGFAFTFVKGAVLSVVAVMKTMRVAYLLATGATVANTAATKTQIVVSKAMRLAMLAGAGVMKALTAAQWLLNAALAANPIGLVIAAVAALVAAGIWMWQNWDKVTAFFTAAWEKIRALFSGFNPLALMRGAFSTMATWLSGFWSNLRDLFGAGLDVVAALFRAFNPLALIRGAFNSMLSWVENFSLFESGQKLLSTLADGIRSAVSGPVDAIKGGLSRIRDHLPFSDAKIGPLSELTKSGSSIMTTLSQGMAKVGTDQMMRPFNRTAGNMVGGFQSGIGGAVSRLSGVGRGAGAAGGGGMTVQVTQHISIDGTGGADVRDQARQGAAEGADELVERLRAVQTRERRLSYG